MSEVDNEAGGEKSSREFLDVVKALYEPGALDKIDELENLQTMVIEFSADELLALESFIAELQKDRALGNESEYAENVCKKAIVNIKWGFNMKTREYVERLVAEAGLSDEVAFHQLEFSHVDKEDGKEIAVAITLDWHMCREDFESFLEFAKGVEGIRIEDDWQGRPGIVISIDNLLAGVPGPIDGEEVGDVLDGINDMSGHMIGGF